MRSQRIGVILSGLIVLAAIAAATLAHPVVGTFELQRRDRLPPAQRFVEYAYRFLLGRPPTTDELTADQKLYEAQGRMAVAERLIASDDFQARSREGGALSVAHATAPGSSVDASNPSYLSQTFVQMYDAGTLASATANDGVGRIGFVLVLTVCLGLLLLLHARTSSPTEATSEIYLPTGFVVGLFAIMSFTWLFYGHLVLDAFSRGKFGYLEWLTQITNLTNARGIWNIWTPYPQGTQELIVAIQTVANAIGSTTNSDVWTGYTIFRIGFDLIFLALPSIFAIYLVSVIASRFDRRTQTISMVTMALSFGVVYYGAASTYVTDPLPVALSLAGIQAISRRDFVIGGLAVGAGAALKLFPLMVIPAVLVLIPIRGAIRLVLATAAVVAVAFGPGAVANFDMFMSPFRWQSSRPPWESWYAFVNWLTNAPHEYLAPYFQDASARTAFGWVFTGITPLASVLQTPVPPGGLRWENVVSTVGTAALLLLCLAARSNSLRSMLRWCLFCLSAFLLFGIGWSPQYELYLIPFILLAFENPFVGAGAALLLQAVTFLEYPLLLPWAYFYGGSAVWLEWSAVLARYLLLCWLCLYVIGAEASWTCLVQRLRSAKP